MKTIRRYVAEASNGKKDEFDNIKDVQTFLSANGEGVYTIYDWKGEWVQVIDTTELNKIMIEEVGTEQ